MHKILWTSTDNKQFQLVVITLNKKLERALEGVKETKHGYNGLTQALLPTSIQKWEKEAEEANRKRGDHLKIYDVQLEQGLDLSAGILKGPLMSVEFFNSTLTGQYLTGLDCQ